MAYIEMLDNPETENIAHIEFSPMIRCTLQHGSTGSRKYLSGTIKMDIDVQTGSLISSSGVNRSLSIDSNYSKTTSSGNFYLYTSLSNSLDGYNFAIDKPINKLLNLSVPISCVYLGLFKTNDGSRLVYATGGTWHYLSMTVNLDSGIVTNVELDNSSQTSVALLSTPDWSTTSFNIYLSARGTVRIGAVNFQIT